MTENEAEEQVEVAIALLEMKGRDGAKEAIEVLNKIKEFSLEDHDANSTD